MHSAISASSTGKWLVRPFLTSKGEAKSVWRETHLRTKHSEAPSKAPAVPVGLSNIELGCVHFCVRSVFVAPATTNDTSKRSSQCFCGTRCILDGLFDIKDSTSPRVARVAGIREDFASQRLHRLQSLEVLWLSVKGGGQMEC
jgi:hypothetical protein